MRTAMAPSTAALQQRQRQWLRAEAAEQDLIDAIADKGGIINPADKAELDALKAAVDTAKGTAQTLVNALPDSESAKDALDLLFRCIHCIDPTCGERCGQRWHHRQQRCSSDSGSVVAAEAAEQDLIDAIADRRRHHQSC